MGANAEIVPSLPQVASVVGLGDEASRRSALDCGDALMGASFALASREGGPADLNNRLLVRLGLLKVHTQPRRLQNETHSLHCYGTSPL